MFFILPVQAKTERPNIVIVLTDDQGKNDIGAEGNPHIITPNIDAFYHDSVRLSNFHVSTTCAPTRGALMTGRHSNRINVPHTVKGRSQVFHDEIMLPQVLQENGYATGHFGKWHLGDNYPFRPEDRGFQEVVRLGAGGVSQGPDFWGNDNFDDTYWKNSVPTKYQGYSTDIFFDEALSFIEKNKHRPFFAYISTNAPHTPWTVPEKFVDLYEGNDAVHKEIKKFYGMITNIDDNFGRLQQKLKELNILDNTIVIFMTDNGTVAGHHVYDAGMRGNKGQITEGGHRVPFYLQWHNKSLNGGRDVKELTAHFDLLPTLVDLLDLKFTPVKLLDGKSIKPLLLGNKQDWPNRTTFIRHAAGI